MVSRCIEMPAKLLSDDHPIIIPVTDGDLIGMLEPVVRGEAAPYEQFFAERFRDIALR